MFTSTGRASLAAFAALALSLGVASSAAAQAFPQQFAPRVERSGSVFHVRACATAEPGHVRCHAHMVTDAAGRPLVAMLQPLVVGRRPTATPPGFGPTDLRAAYGVTGQGSSSITIALVEAYGYTNAERDLGTYRTQFGLPACTTANGCFRKVNQNG